MGNAMGQGTSSCIPYSKGALLLVASANGDVQVALEILRSNPRAAFYYNFKDRSSPLIQAAARGHFELVQQLLEAAVMSEGPERAKRRCIDHANIKRQTALMVACKHGHPECVEYLVTNGADPLLTDERRHNTCLHFAALYGHSECIHKLLGCRSGAGLRTQGEAQVPVARINCINDVDGSRVQFVDGHNGWGLTALHIAVFQGSVNIVKVLLRHGAALEAVISPPRVENSPIRCATGSNALHIAALIGNISMAKLVLEAQEAFPGLELRSHVDALGLRPRDYAQRARNPVMLHLLDERLPVHLLRQIWLNYSLDSGLPARHHTLDSMLQKLKLMFNLEVIAIQRQVTLMDSNVAAPPPTLQQLPSKPAGPAAAAAAATAAAKSEVDQIWGALGGGDVGDSDTEAATGQADGAGAGNRGVGGPSASVAHQQQEQQQQSEARQQWVSQMQDIQGLLATVSQLHVGLQGMCNREAAAAAASAAHGVRWPSSASPAHEAILDFILSTLITPRTVSAVLHAAKKLVSASIMHVSHAQVGAATEIEQHPPPNDAEMQHSMALLSTALRAVETCLHASAQLATPALVDKADCAAAAAVAGGAVSPSCGAAASSAAAVAIALTQPPHLSSSNRTAAPPPAPSEAPTPQAIPTAPGNSPLPITTQLEHTAASSMELPSETSPFPHGGIYGPYNPESSSAQHPGTPSASTLAQLLQLSPSEECMSRDMATDATATQSPTLNPLEQQQPTRSAAEQPAAVGGNGPAPTTGTGEPLHPGHWSSHLHSLIAQLQWDIGVQRHHRRRAHAAASATRAAAVAHHGGVLPPPPQAPDAASSGLPPRNASANPGSSDTALFTSSTCPLSLRHPPHSDSVLQHPATSPHAAPGEAGHAVAVRAGNEDSLQESRRAMHLARGSVSLPSTALMPHAQTSIQERSNEDAGHPAALMHSNSSGLVTSGTGTAASAAAAAAGELGCRRHARRRIHSMDMGTVPEGSGEGSSCSASPITADAGAGRRTRIHEVSPLASEIAAQLSQDNSLSPPGLYPGAAASAIAACTPQPANHPTRKSNTSSSAPGAPAHATFPPRSTQGNTSASSLCEGANNRSDQDLEARSAAHRPRQPDIAALGLAHTVNCVEEDEVDSSSLGGSDEDEEHGMCPICMDTPISVVVSSCQHGLCVQCAFQLTVKGRELPNCPFCRQKIGGFDWTQDTIPVNPIASPSIKRKHKTPRS